MSTSLSLLLVRGLALVVQLLRRANQQMEPSLQMMDWLQFCLVFSLLLMLLKEHSPLSNVEMVISAEGTQVDLEFAVSKIQLTIQLFFKWTGPIVNRLISDQPVYIMTALSLPFHKWSSLLINRLSNSYQLFYKNVSLFIN